MRRLAGVAVVGLAACGLWAGCNAGGEAPMTAPEATPAPTAASSEAASPEGSGAGEATPARTQTATLAGGCFWGMEELIRQLPGVIDTEVGYTGGTVRDATYQDVHTGRSGHAEAVRITYDPAKISYAALLEWFFRMHDPTTTNRQGNDIGTQYRSAIFVDGPEQRAAAEAAIAAAGQSGRWSGAIATTIEPLGAWWPAESYHQDYLQKHPNGYTCHWIRD